MTVWYNALFSNTYAALDDGIHQYDRRVNSGEFFLAVLLNSQMMTLSYILGCCVSLSYILVAPFQEFRSGPDAGRNVQLFDIKSPLVTSDGLTSTCLIYENVTENPACDHKLITGTVYGLVFLIGCLRETQ